MASYYVIGGDTKEYGPIWSEDVRNWIAEGRLNAQSLAKGEGDTAWRTLGSFPEFADVFRVAAPPGTAGTPANADFLGRDYDLDIGRCVTRGWELMKNNFGTVFTAFLAAMALIIVAYIIMSSLFALVMPAHSVPIREALHLLCSAIVSLVAGPMLAGFYLLVIRINRNELVTVGDAFTGFQRKFKDLFLGQLIVGLLVGLCMAPYAMVYDAKMIPVLEQLQQASQHASPEDAKNMLGQMWAAMSASLPVLLVCLIPMTYLSVNLQFTLPLIIDKQMAFWPAMKASWTMVHKHWWYVFGLSIVVGLIGVAGLLGCCVGIVLTVPIGMCAVMIAYETIFGPRQA